MVQMSEAKESFALAILAGHDAVDAYRVARGAQCAEWDMEGEEGRRKLRAAAGVYRRDPYVRGIIEREQAKLRVEVMNRRRKLLDGLERREILAKVARTSVLEILDRETGRIRGDLDPDAAMAITSVQSSHAEDPINGVTRDSVKVQMADKISAIRLDAELSGELKQKVEVGITASALMHALEGRGETGGESVGGQVPEALA